MNITFLLGNGFDLQLGMKTGYKSFLDWYVAQQTDDPDVAQFREYLKDEKSQWWSDAEIAMGQYLGNFSDENINIYFKNIRDFKLRLSEYLTLENLRYNIVEIPDVSDSFKAFLLKSAKDIMLRTENLSLDSRRWVNNTKINFISFNYTDAIDRLIKVLGGRNSIIDTQNGYNTQLGAIYHVHGTLDSNLIMGVDNLDQLNTAQITNFTKLRRTLVKPIVNDELGRNEHDLAIGTIRNSDYLFFYGLSYGESDKSWWQAIKKKLESDTTCQIVLFTRSSDESIRDIIPEDILDYVSDKKDDFLTKIGITSEENSYDNIRKRVFIIRNTERLNISIDNIKEPASV
ncbi:MAG: hypothetical protein IKJ94_01885 [Oscillospiraceae bacterium]|nr:hypothetical protein [Oscillospiraceae bacterium]